MSRLTAFWTDRHGASMVETAIMLPVVMLLGMGAVEFSRGLQQYHEIVTGVADAARYLSHTADPATSATYAKQIAVYGQIGGSTKRVSWWSVGDVTVTIRTIANTRNATTGVRTYRGPDPIKIVKVSTTATYPGFGFLKFLGFNSGLSFGVYQEDRVIGN